MKPTIYRVMLTPLSRVHIAYRESCSDLETSLILSPVERALRKPETQGGGALRVPAARTFDPPRECSLNSERDQYLAALTTVWPIRHAWVGFGVVTARVWRALVRDLARRNQMLAPGDFPGSRSARIVR